MFGVEARKTFDTPFTQSRSHRRVEGRIAPGNPMSLLDQQPRQGPHAGTGNTNDVDMHRDRACDDCHPDARSPAHLPLMSDLEKGYIPAQRDLSAAPQLTGRKADFAESDRLW